MPLWRWPILNGSPAPNHSGALSACLCFRLLLRVCVYWLHVRNMAGVRGRRVGTRMAHRKRLIVILSIAIIAGLTIGAYLDPLLQHFGVSSRFIEEVRMRDVPFWFAFVAVGAIVGGIEMPEYIARSAVPACRCNRTGLCVLCFDPCCWHWRCRRLRFDGILPLCSAGLPHYARLFLSSGRRSRAWLRQLLHLSLAYLCYHAFARCPCDSRARSGIIYDRVRRRFDVVGSACRNNPP